MKVIKTNQGLVNFKGEPFKEEDKKIEIGTVLSNIMGSNHENPSLSWQLGKKFACDETVELKAEDVVFVKKAIEASSTGDKAWLSVMVAGQLLEILDGKEEEPKKK